MKHRKPETKLLDRAILGQAAVEAFRKLDPWTLARNPVMFVVGVASVLATLVFLKSIWTGEANAGVLGQITAWLWFTVLFANFAEAVAEGRGKARADSLRSTHKETEARRIDANGTEKKVNSSALAAGDIVIVSAGEIIPADGEIIEGIASVDESAITGESAPVIRESGGDRSAVTGGTRVVSDWLKLRVTARPGESFLDRMIAMVEGASRQKTPNEVALNILLVGMTIIFLIVVVTLEPFARFSGTSLPLGFLVALLVTLIPTTIGGLLSAIGIAGMDRLVKANVIAKSGRAVEAAGDVDTLLLDKTGTITFGNRMADAFVPVSGVSERDLAHAAALASLADDTAEGKSIVDYAKTHFGFTAGAGAITDPVAFSAETRMSGEPPAAVKSVRAQPMPY